MWNLKRGVPFLSHGIIASYPSFPQSTMCKYIVKNQHNSYQRLSPAKRRTDTCQGMFWKFPALLYRGACLLTHGLGGEIRFNHRALMFWKVWTRTFPWFLLPSWWWMLFRPFNSYPWGTGNQQYISRTFKLVYPSMSCKQIRHFLYQDVCSLPVKTSENWQQIP